MPLDDPLMTLSLSYTEWAVCPDHEHCKKSHRAVPDIIQPTYQAGAGFPAY